MSRYEPATTFFVEYGFPLICRHNIIVWFISPQRRHSLIRDAAQKLSEMLLFGIIELYHGRFAFRKLASKQRECRLGDISDWYALVIIRPFVSNHETIFRNNVYALYTHILTYFSLLSYVTDQTWLVVLLFVYESY